MADQKISALTAWTTPIGADYVPVVDSAGVATKRITLTNLGLIDGWIPASETWTYASASTITVPSGAASKYSIGDKIKWTQTGVRYGVIVAVADTLLTIQVTTDYVVSDAAISANYYSKQLNPLGYPHWFNTATPSFTVAYFDDGAGGQPSVTQSRINISGRTVYIHLHGTGSKAGTDKYIVDTT